MWDEGYGAGLSECDWGATVAGRFLRPWERAELAAGWKAGLADRAAWAADMESGVVSVAGDEIPF